MILSEPRNSTPHLVSGLPVPAAHMQTSITFGENDFVINFFLKDILQKKPMAKLPVLKTAMSSS